jgi:invasion protein IalB
MRSMMLAVLAVFLAIPALAGAGDSAIGNETPTANQAQDKTKADTVDEAKEPEPFKIPAGYLTKKRGKKTVYCRKAMESGTRFSQEKCYSEEQLRAMESDREQEQANIDQSRKVCASVESCGSN